MTFIPGVSLGTKSMTAASGLGPVGLVFPSTHQAGSKDPGWRGKERGRPSHLPQGPSALFTDAVRPRKAAAGKQIALTKTSHSQMQALD